MRYGMADSVYSIFQNTLQDTSIWINDMKAELNLDSDRKAYLALRAALHAMRDQLPLAQVVQFGEELPLLLRGVYFEHWKLRSRSKSRDSIIESMASQLTPDVKPEDCIRALMKVMERHLSWGDVYGLQASVSKELAILMGEQ